MVGVRLLDTVAESPRDVSVNHVIEFIQSGRIKIENLKVVDGKLKAVGGAIEIYGVGGLSQSCTILGVIKKLGGVVGYKVSDSSGVIKKLSVENAVGVAEFIGISNGKLVEKEGKKFISAIEGDYPVIEVTPKVSENERVVNVSDNPGVIKLRVVDKYPKRVVIKDYKIVDSETENPICNHGQLTFDRIHYYSPGKVVIASRRSTYNYKSAIYKYDIQKDEFEHILVDMNTIDKVTPITGGLLLSYMSTGGYGQFYETCLALYNNKTNKVSGVIKTKLITSNKFVECGSDELGNVIIYDVAKSDIGAFSHGKPRLNLYEVSFDNMSIDTVGDVTVEGKNG